MSESDSPLHLWELLGEILWFSVTIIMKSSDSEVILSGCFKRDTTSSIFEEWGSKSILCALTTTVFSGT